MTHINRDRWKEIIGPEYDLTVKRFLSCVNELKKAAEEHRLVMSDNLQKRILDAAEKKTFDPEEGLKGLMGSSEIIELMPGIADMIGLIQNIEGRLKNDPKRFFEDLISMAEKLPEDSQLFYKQQFAWPKDKAISDFAASFEKMKKQERDKLIKKETTKIASLICALIFQYLLQGLERVSFEDRSGEKLLSNTDFLMTFVSLTYSLLSQMAFQSTIKELLAKHDDESLLRAVRIDKSVVCSDILKRRIETAQFSGDSVFLKRLGNNIAYNPLERESQYYESYLVLRTFWKAGLNLLTPKNMDNFLTACGIVHSPTPESLKKFIVRTIHPIYGK